MAALVVAALEVGIDARFVDAADVDQVLDPAVTTIVVAGEPGIVGRVRAFSSDLAVRCSGRQDSTPCESSDLSRTTSYRNVADVILRSRLEVAELGDRSFALLPSAAGLAPAVRDRRTHASDDITVLVASTGPGSSPEWLEIAMIAATQLGRAGLMALEPGDPPVEDTSLAPFELSRLRPGAVVVSPLHDYIALAEVLEVHAARSLDVDGDHREMSTGWARVHCPATTADELARRLGEAIEPRSCPRPLDELCTFVPFRGIAPGAGGSARRNPGLALSFIRLQESTVRRAAREWSWALERKST